jgi:hypothetical protein
MSVCHQGWPSDLQSTAARLSRNLAPGTTDGNESAQHWRREAVLRSGEIAQSARGANLFI